MISIIRTAYPRFKRFYNEEELEKIFRPAEAEIQFVIKNARGDRQKLTLMTLLKAHQHLGYVPATGIVPKSLWRYLSAQLGLPQDCQLIEQTETNKKTFHRYRRAIRHYLGVFPWSEEGLHIAESTVKKAAFTMSNPPDLINVAIEKLIEQRYELPAFSTLARLVGHIRSQVHLELYEKLDASLESAQRQMLDKLLQVEEGERLTDFNRIGQTPGKPTLKLMRDWTERLEWLRQLLDTSQLFEMIAPTKVRQFAAEIKNAETQDLLDMNPAKRYTHLVCLIHERQVAAKDQLVDMFLRRMKRTRIGAEQKLEVLQEHFRGIEEQMLALFSKIAGYTINFSQNNKLGKLVRILLAGNGGAAYLLERYVQVAAYHNHNFLPLLWQVYKNNRSAVLDLAQLLNIQSCSEDNQLVEALEFVLSFRNMRKEYLPYEIELDFMGGKWISYVEAKENGAMVLKRRELEIAVLFHVADGLRCADLYVPDSEKYADYRKQLLPWAECEKLLKTYCAGIGIPSNAKDFVDHLKQQLIQAAAAADKAYPENSQFFIDEQGEPHLKRLRASSLPKGLERFEKEIKDRMPGRDLLDILKRVQCWVPYTRHFGPPSGSNTKLKDAVYKYLFTIFGYGCNLGANQTARHTHGMLSSRILRRINKQHVDIRKIDAAITDLINAYNQWDLTSFWGDGSEMIVDGTHIELIENNMLGSRHIRYGAYGGIAYKYLSNNYIALFTRFISCGAWEAIYILD